MLLKENISAGDQRPATNNSNFEYITVVIPFRGRSYWQDFSRVTPLFELLNAKNISSTVLLQYETLNDREVTQYLKNLSSNFELGLFLEVDESLAQNSQASYLYGIGDRAQANKILLSGYEVAERKRMVDKVFNRFHSIFGKYPKSVGSWHIDALTQGYLKEKYNITSVLDVADQYQTDTYGIWGKPWGIAYIPSKFNPLVPFQNQTDNSGLVKIQWAFRDPVKGYGLTVKDSTYSVQANDYVSFHNLDTDYFSHLAGIYLRSLNQNHISQLTIGLEAGQESSQFLDELERQIEVLKKYNFVTMKEFADAFDTNSTSPLSLVIVGQDYDDSNSKAFWFNFSKYRSYIAYEKNQLILKDLRIYKKESFYSDLFYKDANTKLERIVPSCIDNARFGQKIILLDEIKSVNVIRFGNGFILKTINKNGKENIISLSNDGIRLGNKEIIPLTINKLESNLFTDNFLNLIFSFQRSRRSKSKVIPAYSKIGGSFYFGLPFYPDKLVGITDKLPFIGIFEFPFQVLSKFKTIDLEKLSFVYALSFVNLGINCKINL